MPAVNARHFLVAVLSTAIVLLATLPPGSLARARAAEPVAPSPSELLEKAIYTEDTVGNLDEAIRLYLKVVSDAEATRRAAAKAQHRLALCYLKQGKKAEATAALEKLVKEFPGEKELIASARQRLPSTIALTAVPWANYEMMQLNVRLAGGLKIGTYFYIVEEDLNAAKPAVRCKSRSYITLGNQHSLSRVLVERERMAPLESYWKHTLLGEVDAHYKAGAVELIDRLTKQKREVPIEGEVFDNEECAQLMRRLPLALGYKTTLPVFPTLTGQFLPIELTVKSKEMVTVPAGKFECFKFVLSVVNQTFYVSTDPHHYLVKFEAGPAIVELAGATSLLAPPTKPFSLKAKSFELMMPPTWLPYGSQFDEAYKSPTYRLAVPTANGDDVSYLLNTENITMTAIAVKARNALKTASVKTWMDSQIAYYQKELENFTIRKDGRTERKIGGHPAESLVADYTANGKPMAIYATDVLSDKFGIVLSVKTERDTLDAYRKQLDPAIESLKLAD